MSKILIRWRAPLAASALQVAVEVGLLRYNSCLCTACNEANFKVLKRGINSNPLSCTHPIGHCRRGIVLY